MSDTIIVEMQQGRKLAPFLNESITQKLVEYRNIYFNLSYNSPQQAKLTTGSLLGEILGHMKNFTKGQSFQHIIYSAHDTNVASLMSSFGDFNNLAPPYTSSVIFELHKLSSVRISIIIIMIFTYFFY